MAHVPVLFQNESGRDGVLTGGVGKWVWKWGGIVERNNYSAANAEKNLEKKLENFQRWVRKKGINRNCVECGSASFSLMGRDGSNTVLPLDTIFEFYNTYAFECKNCGYIKQFSSAIVERGLTEDDG
ncbi:hypothetical protein [Acidomonas methanolica]|uniref:hypothetical protein n=1 Tax=Acidomonas methanolica TaxID=437 RepID=UPI00195542DA|nr:hypothetical protein [Acidomonas methanolica]GBQ59532.1 hypothetical protein AA0498_2778 [Acidomonas methanolica]